MPRPFVHRNRNEQRGDSTCPSCGPVRQEPIGPICSACLAKDYERALQQRKEAVRANYAATATTKRTNRDAS